MCHNEEKKNVSNSVTPSPPKARHLFVSYPHPDPAPLKCRNIKQMPEAYSTTPRDTSLTLNSPFPVYLG